MPSEAKAMGRDGGCTGVPKEGTPPGAAIKRAEACPERLAVLGD